MVKNSKVTIDLRFVSAVLLAIIVVLFVMLKPWQGTSDTPSRTISIDGQATITEEPDEFQFMPTYQEKGTDRAAIQQRLISKVNEIVAKLKDLGVSESKISLSSASYDSYWVEDGQEVTSNTLTITVSDKELSQKVQDYLITTSPTGQLSPIPSFSKAKQEQVEEKARAEAIANAKQKAERTLSELDQKLGKVVKIEDQTSGSVYPVDARLLVAEDGATSSSMPVLPGEQDITYTVRVIFEIK